MRQTIVFCRALMTNELAAQLPLVIPAFLYSHMACIPTYRISQLEPPMHFSLTATTWLPVASSGEERAE